MHGGSIQDVDEPRGEAAPPVRAARRRRRHILWSPQGMQGKKTIYCNTGPPAYSDSDGTAKKGSLYVAAIVTLSNYFLV